jgi:hypothetical protein
MVGECCGRVCEVASEKALLQKYLLLKPGTPGTPPYTWLLKIRGRDFLATLSLHLLF